VKRRVISLISPGQILVADGRALHLPSDWRLQFATTLATSCSYIEMRRINRSNLGIEK
jgi:hypothetical protein